MYLRTGKEILYVRQKSFRIQQVSFKVAAINHQVPEYTTHPPQRTQSYANKDFMDNISKNILPFLKHFCA